MAGMQASWSAGAAPPQPPPLHAISLCVFVGILVFYLATNTLLQLCCYTRRGPRAAWKSQPGEAPRRAGEAWRPWLPACVPCGHVKDGAPALLAAGGWALASANTVLAAAAAAATAEASVRGWSAVHAAPLVGGRAWAAAAAALLASVALESILEYYWHRAMHWRPAYLMCHRLHHAARAPSPFDDMLIHPLEAAGYYCILYSPAFLIPQHWAAFCVYMSVMGLCGVLDHSGVRVRVPGLYDTSDHDSHHRLVNVNFAFPFPWLDILHGTYEGEYCGRSYHRAERSGGDWSSRATGEVARAAVAGAAPAQPPSRRRGRSPARAARTRLNARA